MIRQPITRQTREVALFERFSSQKVNPINRIFKLMIFRIRRSLRPGQRVTVSQKKKVPLTKQATPSMFLLVVAPTYMILPDQNSYKRPFWGKYLMSRIESGISR